MARLSGLVSLGTRDLRLEERDAALELGERERVEVFLAQEVDRIVGAEVVFFVHVRSVDPAGGQVNKPTRMN